MIYSIQRMPPEISSPLLQAAVLQVAAIRHAKALLTSSARSTQHRHRAETSATAPSSVRLAAQSGDIFLILGAAWTRPHYGLLLQQVREQYRLEPWLLLYDLIPLRRPEWCVAELVEGFTAWLTATLPQCRKLFAISRLPRPMSRCMRARSASSLDGPVEPVPIGTGFGLATPHEEQRRFAPGDYRHAAAMRCSSPPWRPERTTCCCSGCGADCWPTCHGTAYLYAGLCRTRGLAGRRSDAAT